MPKMSFCVKNDLDFDEKAIDQHERVGQNRELQRYEDAKFGSGFLFYGFLVKIQAMTASQNFSGT